MRRQQTYYPTRSDGRKTRRVLSLVAGLLVTYSHCGHTLTDTKSHEAYEAAVATFYEGELAQSAIHLKNAIQADSDHLPSRILLAELQLARGNGAGAESELRTARERGADPASTTPLLIKALLMQGQYDEALEVPLPDGLNQMAASDIHTLQGHAHLGNNAFKQADTSYARATELVPYNIDALLGRTLVATVEGNSDAALALADQVLLVAPANASALLLQAAIHQHRGDTAEGMAAVVRLMIIDPDAVSTRMTRALLLIDSDDLAGALEDVDFVLGQNEPDPIAEFFKYSLYSGHSSQALDVLGAAVAQQSGDAALVAMLGDAYQRTGDHEQAQEMYNLAVRLAPDSVSLRSRLAATLIDSGEVAQGVRELTIVLASEPDDPRAQYLQALAFFRQGNDRGALARAATLAERHPADPMPLLLTAHTLERRGDFDGARQAYDRALERDPRNTDAMDGQARLSLAAGERNAGLKQHADRMTHAHD